MWGRTGNEPTPPTTMAVAMEWGSDRDAENERFAMCACSAKDTPPSCNDVSCRLMFTAVSPATENRWESYLNWLKTKIKINAQDMQTRVQEFFFTKRLYWFDFCLIVQIAGYTAFPQTAFQQNYGVSASRCLISQPLGRAIGVNSYIIIFGVVFWLRLYSLYSKWATSECLPSSEVLTQCFFWYV